MQESTRAAEAVSEMRFKAPRHHDAGQANDSEFQETLEAELQALQNSLREELQQHSQLDLVRRAESQGIDAELLDAAMQDTHPEASIIELILVDALPDNFEVRAKVLASEGDGRHTPNEAHILAGKDPAKSLEISVPEAHVEAVELASQEQIKCIWARMLDAARKSTREERAARKAADERRAKLEAFAAAAEEEAAAAKMAASPVGEEPDEPLAHWVQERDSLRSLHGDIDSSLASLTALVTSLQAKFAAAGVEQNQIRRTFAETKEQEARITERRSIATGELNDAMKSIVQLPTTTKNGTPRRWQVPVDINELSRLDNALSAAKLNGVESKLVLDGKRLMRTKRAEARLAMLYAACEQREDPAVWVKCKHALELDPALGGMLPHLYRAYDEAVAEYADAKLISDVQAMKLQLAQHKADISRQKEEERIREAQRAKEAEQEHEMMHHYTLRKIARCELDTSRAFHRLSSKDKRNKGSGQPAVTTLDTISDTDTGTNFFQSPPADYAPPRTADAQRAGQPTDMPWSPGYRNDELAGLPIVTRSDEAEDR